MSDLAAWLRDSGVALDVDPGWRTRGGASFAPAGIVWHHTAGHNSLTTVRNGRPGLPGPLANWHIAKDGRVTLIAGRRANHAGMGSGVVLGESRTGVAPSGDAAARRLADDTSGNAWYYGAECDNLGDGRDPWPGVQLVAMARTAAAVSGAHGWAAARNIGHREWTRRKIDPAGFTMPAFRLTIADLLGGNMPRIDHRYVALVPGTTADATGRVPCWTCNERGEVGAWNGAPFHGPHSSLRTDAIIGIEARQDGRPGYVLVSSDADDGGGLSTYSFP